ncbi:unnamed protein product [Lampetra fluviatilis]
MTRDGLALNANRYQQQRLRSNLNSTLPPPTRRVTCGYPAGLTLLDLGKNQLRVLPEGAFDRLGNLQELYMCCNKLTELPRGIEKLTQLRRLSLFQNQLKSVPDIEPDC